MQHNWTWISQHLFEWSFQGYETALGFLFWPIFISGVIGYVYLKNQSLTVAAGSILILIAVFSNTLAGVPVFTNFLWVATALIFTAVIIIIIRRWIK